jgi:hypothetical protein
MREVLQQETITSAINSNNAIVKNTNEKNLRKTFRKYYARFSQVFRVGKSIIRGGDFQSSAFS